MASERKFTKLGADLTDLELASVDRLADAKALVAAGRSAMAISAGLYAVEIKLKALICVNLDLDGLPRPFEIHDLEELLLLAGLSRKIESPSLTQVKIDWDKVLTLSPYLNELRYSPESKWPVSQAIDFLGWLDHPNHGVLTWLSSGP